MRDTKYKNPQAVATSMNNFQILLTSIKTP